MAKEDKDDFFGIEVLTSLDFEQKKQVFATPPSVEQQNKKLPGVEFFDSAFFPEFDDNSPETSSQSQQAFSSSNYVDDQYFGKSSIKATQMSPDPEVQSHNKNANMNLVEKEEDLEQEYLGNAATNHGQELFSEMVPVWKMNQKEMIEYLASQVLYSDDKIIAFDKPYGLAYSGGPFNRPQFDRLLQDVKSIVCPKVERLHLVKSLDRNVSGIMLFAKSSAVQNDLKNMFNKKQLSSEYRGVIRGRLSSNEVKVNVPLVKQIKDKDVKLIPVLDTTKRRNDIQFVETEFRELGEGATRYCSYIGISVKREIPHQIRAHLFLNHCPLIGENKYTNEAPRPPKFGDHILRLLGISSSQARKLPMLLHHKQMDIPTMGQDGRSLIINSPIPAHFSFLLKKLKLLKRRKTCPNLIRCPPEAILTLIYDIIIGRVNFESIRTTGFSFTKFVLLIAQAPIPAILYNWEYRLNHVFLKQLELERILWNLSTLGGAFSAMGDYDLKFADTAISVSMIQLRLAKEFGDPVLIARCHLYVALALAQQGLFKEAYRIVRIQARYSQELQSHLLFSCCQGVWAKITTIQKLGTEALISRSSETNN
ncbi:unnamed protein product, partial [Mesorhabditis belari]|uniref:Pseudouridine synthase RsuA/RluA-like domain-containing protein n=1 Tax=Mesorhabditis belari TaxID=2138241 RepID=A0AAF3E9Y9_9BILA